MIWNEHYTHTHTLTQTILKEKIARIVERKRKKVISLKWNISKIWCKLCVCTICIRCMCLSYLKITLITVQQQKCYENSISSHMKWIAEESKKGGWMEQVHISSYDDGMRKVWLKSRTDQKDCNINKWSFECVWREERGRNEKENIGNSFFLMVGIF